MSEVILSNLEGQNHLGSIEHLNTVNADNTSGGFLKGWIGGNKAYFDFDLTGAEGKGAPDGVADVRIIQHWDSPSSASSLMAVDLNANNPFKFSNFGGYWLEEAFFKNGNNPTANQILDTMNKISSGQSTEKFTATPSTSNNNVELPVSINGNINDFTQEEAKEYLSIFMHKYGEHCDSPDMQIKWDVDPNEKHTIVTGNESKIAGWSESGVIHLAPVTKDQAEYFGRDTTLHEAFHACKAEDVMLSTPIHSKILDADIIGFSGLSLIVKDGNETKTWTPVEEGAADRVLMSFGNYEKNPLSIKESDPLPSMEYFNLTTHLLDLKMTPEQLLDFQSHNDFPGFVAQVQHKNVENLTADDYDAIIGQFIIALNSPKP